jgi:hypothetical protein
VDRDTSKMQIVVGLDDVGNPQTPRPAGLKGSASVKTVDATRRALGRLVRTCRSYPPEAAMRSVPPEQRARHRRDRRGGYHAIGMAVPLLVLLDASQP